VPLVNTLQDFFQHEAVLPHFPKTILQSLYPSPHCVNPHRPIFPKSHSVKSLRYCELHKSLTSHQDKKTHDNCAFVRTDRRFLREIGFRNRRGPKFPENLIFKMSLILAEIVKKNDRSSRNGCITERSRRKSEGVNPGSCENLQEHFHQVLDGFLWLAKVVGEYSKRVNK
jgi:hypothetical protein